MIKGHKAAGQRMAAAEQAQKEGLLKVLPEQRPLFHLTPPTGWMNDPNGFSFYKGRFHLFFQYNPYSTHWDTMHWGHAVSDDLLQWEYLPVALAPDDPYDEMGCFSGCAVGLPDGKMMLMYTSLRYIGDPVRKDAPGFMDSTQIVQTQSAAVGDGITFEKYENNPVIPETVLPEDISRHDFRDPKILCLRDGTYLAVAAAKGLDGYGQILMFRSRDGFSWEYWKPLIRNYGCFGKMWECPDFFELDGKWVLIISPMEMLPVEGRYPNGYGCMALIGDFDESSGTFAVQKDQPLDCGIDFYAAQTLLSPDGRRIMVGWMQNWSTLAMHRDDLPWAGQMSLPRELFFKGDVLCQRPAAELAQRHVDEVHYKSVPVSSGEVSLYGVSGRMIDLDLEVCTVPGTPLYRWFSIRFAQNEIHSTRVFFFPLEGMVRLDRSNSGSRQAVVHERVCSIGPSPDGRIRMRIILDRFSAEVFLNDGEYVMSAVIYTDLSADKVSFLAEGRTILNVKKRSIRGR